MPPPDLKSAFIGILAAISVAPIAALFGLVIGGFRVGHLEKTVVMTLQQSALVSFLERLRTRLAEIGFEEDSGTNRFFQGQDCDPEMRTHATKKKVLGLEILNSGNPEVTVKMTLRYLDFIIGDTGEGSYRDGFQLRFGQG